MLNGAKKALASRLAVIVIATFKMFALIEFSTIVRSLSFNATLVLCGCNNMMNIKYGDCVLFHAEALKNFA